MRKISEKEISGRDLIETDQPSLGRATYFQYQVLYPLVNKTLWMKLMFQRRCGKLLWHVRRLRIKPWTMVKNTEGIVVFSQGGDPENGWRKQEWEIYLRVHRNRNMEVTYMLIIALYCIVRYYEMGFNTYLLCTGWVVESGLYIWPWSHWCSHYHIEDTMGAFSPCLCIDHVGSDAWQGGKSPFGSKTKLFLGIFFITCNLTQF